MNVYVAYRESSRVCEFDVCKTDNAVIVNVDHICWCN